MTAARLRPVGLDLRPVGLTLRLHRFEVIAFTLLAVLGIALTIVVAARLDAVGYGAHCVLAMREGGLTPPGCEFKINEFYGIVQSEAGPVSALLTFVPFLAALMVGVAVVGREVERGTTRLAWALTPSRMTWLAHRLGPVLLVIVAVGLLEGIAANRLLAATEPGLDPANAFEQFGSRGPILAARAVFVLSVAVLVGAVVGRTLPALILAGLIAIVGIVGGSYVHDRILRSEAIELPGWRAGDLYIDQRFRLPDGRLVDWTEMERYDPPPANPDDTTIWPTLPEVVIGIPGSRYNEVQLRELGALAGGSLVALLMTAFVVQRRRPG